jgi:hypothetical protein
MPRTDKAVDRHGHRRDPHLRPGGPAKYASPPNPNQQDVEQFKRGRSLTFDTEAFKNRNVIERSVNVLTQWPAMATR